MKLRVIPHIGHGTWVTARKMQGKLIQRWRDLSEGMAKESARTATLNTSSGPSCFALVRRSVLSIHTRVSDSALDGG